MVVDNNSSATWKVIMKIRDKLADSLSREITHGRETDLWKDPWINGKSLIDFLGLDTYSAYGCPSRKVGSIIRNNTWNYDSIPYDSGQKRQIEYMPLYFNRESDMQSWKHTNKDFTTKLAWEATRSKDPKIGWHKIFWDKVNCPKRR